MNQANVSTLGYIGRKPTDTRESDEWYTPIEYVERARKVMGKIDLDPFSCDTANKRIGAEKIFTLENNAIGQPWSNGKKVTVWANPPYGRGVLTEAVGAFLGAWNAGEVSQAIILVNNASETQWCQDLAAACSAVCMVSKRIQFWNADGKAQSGNTRGQFFFYFGTRVKSFRKEFGTAGVVFS